MDKILYTLRYEGQVCHRYIYNYIPHSSHGVVMSQCSDTIDSCSSALLCQVTVHQDPKFQTCQPKFGYVTSLYPRNWKPGAKQVKRVFDLGPFKPLWGVLAQQMWFNTFEGMEWQYGCGDHCGFLVCENQLQETTEKWKPKSSIKSQRSSIVNELFRTRVSWPNCLGEQSDGLGFFFVVCCCCCCFGFGLFVCF